METRTDVLGNPFGRCSADAIAGFDEAANLFHAYFADPIERIDRVLDAEPDFAMGLCLKGGILATTTEKGAEPGLRDIVQRLGALSAGSTPRERGHSSALRAWLRGDQRGATEAWGRVLHEYPRDLLALQLAHLGDFYLGQSTMLRDRPAQVLCEWGEGVPGRGFVLGMHAFGLEESGHYDLAERQGRAAFDLNPRDPWTVHAVTHVMEMQGRTDDGIDWIEGSSPHWSDGNMFAFHNWWHLALYRLDRGEIDAVLALYDERIRPQPSEVALELIDATSLLWRLLLRDADAGDRWDELADHWSHSVDDGYYAFNDVHAVMALAATGRDEVAEHQIATMHRACERGGCNAAMTREVGLPAAVALLDFCRGRYESTIDALLPVLPIAHRFGGSHAQRDLLWLTTVEAALRCGRTGTARALVAQRLASKPESPHNRELAARAGLNT